MTVLEECVNSKGVSILDLTPSQFQHITNMEVENKMRELQRKLQMDLFSLQKEMLWFNNVVMNDEAGKLLYG